MKMKKAVGGRFLPFLAPAPDLPFLEPLPAAAEEGAFLFFSGLEISTVFSTTWASATNRAGGG